jgi:hypothetical protein
MALFKILYRYIYISFFYFNLKRDLAPFVFLRWENTFIKIWYFFLNYFLYFLDYFYVLILKINFLKYKKYYINIF